MKVRSVLVADDDERILDGFCSVLPKCGVEVLAATGRVAAVELARAHHPRWAIVDLHLGSDSGLDLVKDLIHEHPDMRVIVFTAYASIATTVEAMRIGAADVVPKPCSSFELLRRLENRNGSKRVATATPSVDRALWEHVHRVLDDCHGNKSEAARRLGRPRSWITRFLSRPAPNENE